MHRLMQLCRAKGVDPFVEPHHEQAGAGGMGLGLGNPSHQFRVPRLT